MFEISITWPKKKLLLKATYIALERSLQAIEQHLKRHNFQEPAVPKIGCDHDRLHWPTIFSVQFKVLPGSNIT